MPGPILERAQSSANREFLRLTWVSEQARSTWEPRIHAIVSARRALQGAAALNRGGTCLMTGAAISPEEAGKDLSIPTAMGEGLWNARLSSIADAHVSAILHGRLVVGSRSGLTALLAAWSDGDFGWCLRSLGFPDCCSAALQLRSAKDKAWDPFWSMLNPLAIDSQEGTLSIEAAADSPCNLSLYRIGIASVDHFPCKLDCSASRDIRIWIKDLAQSLNLAKEIEWREAVLSWPTKWSALHGIVEVQTPVVKFIHDGAWSDYHHVVRLIGDSYPTEGAVGLEFPYNSAPSSHYRNTKLRQDRNESTISRVGGQRG